MQRVALPVPEKNRRVGGEARRHAPGFSAGGKHRHTPRSEAGKLQRIDNARIAMWILMIEAGVALFLLVFIVWWTMYSGKKPTDQGHQQLPPAGKDETDKLER